MKRTDRHHIFWYKREYSRGWLKRLREHWYCSLEIPRDTLHRRIHYEVSHVPVPRIGSVKSAFEQLTMLEKHGAISRDDDIEKRLKVLLALFDYMEPETTKALEKQLKVVREFKKPL